MTLTIPLDDVLVHIDRALDGILATVAELDDETANRRPDFDGANTPYALVAHCCGMLEFWGGQVLAGREVQRDRGAEFFAAGSVADLPQLVREQRAQLAKDLVGFDGAAAPVGTLRERDIGRPYTRTQGGCLMHIYEELAQHRGQLEVTVDILTADTNN